MNGVFTYLRLSAALGRRRFFFFPSKEFAASIHDVLSLNFRAPRVNKQQQGAERNLVNKLQHSIKITFVRSLALFIKQLIKQVNQKKFIRLKQENIFHPS